MATFNLRRFSKIDTLRRVAPEHLINFLARHADYFSGRGLELPSVESGDELDYIKLSLLLLNPDANTPNDLSEALYYIDEMSTLEGFDSIQDAIEGTDIDIAVDDNAAYADLAIQVWMQKPAILERLRSEQFLLRPRSFDYFKATNASDIVFEQPSDETIHNLEGDLDEWFAKKRRGRESKVFVYVKDDFVCFLVRHGAPFTRESIIKEGESSSLFYRPEKFDVIVYNPATGEIRMHAKSKGEKELYRTMFGLHFFGDKEFFDGKSKFTLEPLREDGEDSLLCEDVEGMDWVRLKEVQIYRGGTFKDVEIRKSEDLFASLRAQERILHAGGDLIKASFLIKFSDSKSARTVVLSSGNRAQFKRDDDAEILEEWLIQRGFIINDTEENVEQPLAMAVSG